MKNKFLTSIISVALIGLIAIPATMVALAPKEKILAVEDPIEYAPDKESFVSYNAPDRVIKAGDEPAFRSATKVTIHYHNDDKACGTRRFYTWVTGVDGKERKPDKIENDNQDMSITLDFNELTDYLEMPSIFFIIKVAGTWAGQSADIELKYQDFPPEEDGSLEVWTIPGEGNSIEIYKTEAETKFPKIKTAKFSDWNTIHCEADEKPMYYKLYAFDKNYLRLNEDQQIAKKQFHLFKEGNPSNMVFDIKFNYTAKINVQYVIESEYASNKGRIQRVIVSSEYLYGTTRFEQYYNYRDSDLGMTYNEDYVTFKLWSPTSALVKVNIYSNGTPKSLSKDGSDACRSYNMNYVRGGVWELKILTETPDQLLGKYYTYTLINSNGTVEAMDPYAKASGINGLRAYIYNKESVEANPDGWDEVPLRWDGKSGYDIATSQDLSIYEVHIRDLTIDDTWVSNQGNINGTFGAFAESGTTYTKDGKTVSTGYDHIRDLGVKAIQIMPVFDADNDERIEKYKYNWAYNPLNYNCVDGAFASDPYNPLSSIKEFKNVVKSYSNNGNHTRVIMDVVYNHVSSASSSCFNKIMPKYYFRYNEKWEYYDGSGCSNEVKTDATMMSKFIVDSLTYWATEYKIKGFRFDLMGLIDSQTLKKAKEALYLIDPDIVIYGEGWTSGGYHGPSNNPGSETAICYSTLYASESSPGAVGAFNDTGRNALKGSNDDGYNQNPYPQWGFISQGSSDVGNKSSIVSDMIKGIHTEKGANPTQTVNYVSCHDNYTLWDQLNYSLSSSHSPTDHQPGTKPNVSDVVRATIASHAAVMSSNGMAFIQGGEELYRTKTYDKDELKELEKEGLVRPYPTYPHWVDPKIYPDTVIATEDVLMYGEVVSHNSYKAGDYVNSFKWDRKISVDGTSTYEYNEVWQKMIKTHSLTTKYSYPDNCNTPKLNSWNVYDGSSAFATWVADAVGNGGYYFVIAGRGGGEVGIGLDNTTVVYKTRDYKYENGKLILDPYSFIAFKVN